MANSVSLISSYTLWQWSHRSITCTDNFQNQFGFNYSAPTVRSLLLPNITSNSCAINFIKWISRSFSLSLYSLRTSSVELDSDNQWMNCESIAIRLCLSLLACDWSENIYLLLISFFSCFVWYVFGAVGRERGLCPPEGCYHSVSWLLPKLFAPTIPHVFHFHFHLSLYKETLI